MTDFAEREKIYTNGSKFQDGRVGCAFVIPEKNRFATNLN